MNSIKKLAMPMVASVVALAATNAFGQFLTLIPEISGDANTVNMQGRAITPDGMFVAGLSGTRGFLYSVAGGTSVNVISGDGAQSSVANGIGYRTSGGTELIISGLTGTPGSGGLGPAEWMTTDGGATFANKRRNTVLSLNNMGTANQLGSTLGSDVYYVSSSRDTTSQPIYETKLSGAWGASGPATVNEANKGLSSTDRGIMNGISANGRAVGRRGAGSTTYFAYVLDYAAGTPAAYAINTLNDGVGAGTPGTTLGELWSVSGNGYAVFGRSFLTGTAGTYYGFKTTISGFAGTHAQGAVNALPLFGDETGSVSTQVPYGASEDGRYAVGMDYRGAEHAVMWDTGDPNPANWWVLDLTQYASDNGVLGDFSLLTRAYSIAALDDGRKIITGQGNWVNPDDSLTYTRAWILEVPEPNALAVLLTGLGLLIGRGIWMRKRV